ncbi:MAG: hypothetical protein O2816_00155 [Planctomycetota bacterium]|nr:hypothetical protein [Planctomycetota bacterium]
MSYPALLGLTVLTELVIAAVFAPRERRSSFLLVCVLVNAITHPLAFALHGASAVGSMAAIEVGVILLEALGYRLAAKASPARALTVATIANGVTWMLSFLI